VYYQDTDAGGVVFHAAYLDFLERARMDWLRARSFNSTHLLARYQLFFIVRKVELYYLKPALLDDMLAVSASVEKLGHAQLTFNQQVRRDGETLLRGRVNVACVAAGSLKPMPFPEEIRATLAEGAKMATTQVSPVGQPRRHLNRV
jgi:acyl-CoA thioester hydrolase